MILKPEVHQIELPHSEMAKLPEHPEPCPLCAVIAREARGHIIRETKRTATIVALEGHLLLLPKMHLTPNEVERFPATGRELGEEQFRTLARLEQNGIEGVNMQLNFGALAGQKVLHTHIHFFIREPGDTLGWFPVGLRHKRRSVRNQLAEGFRKMLSG